MAGCPAWSAAPFAHAYRQPTRIASPRVSPAHAYRLPTNALAPISISLMSATLSLPRTKRTSEPKVVSNSISQNSFMRSLQSLSQCSRSSSTDVDSEPRCLPDTPVPAPSLTTAREARALPKRSTGSDSVRAYAQRVDDVVKLIDQKDQAATAAVGKLLGQAAQKDLVLESQARHANHHAAVVSTALRARFRAVSVTARAWAWTSHTRRRPSAPVGNGGIVVVVVQGRHGERKVGEAPSHLAGLPPPTPQYTDGGRLSAPWTTVPARSDRTGKRTKCGSLSTGVSELAVADLMLLICRSIMVCSLIRWPRESHTQGTARCRCKAVRRARGLQAGMAALASHLGHQSSESSFRC